MSLSQFFGRIQGLVVRPAPPQVDPKEQLKAELEAGIINREQFNALNRGGRHYAGTNSH